MVRGSAQQRTRPLIAWTAVGGAIALGAAILVSPPALDSATLGKAAILAVITGLAELISIQVRHGEDAELLTLFELAMVADLVLLPGSLGAITALVGIAIALAVERRPLEKFVFNLGQYAMGVIPAAALYHGAGGDFSTTGGLIALVAGMAVFTAVNLVVIAQMISVTQDKPLRQVLADESGISFALGLGNSAVGLVGVALYLSRPALVPAVLAPALALHLAFRGWVQQKELSAAMAEEKTKLERILEHSSEGIVLADADGSVVLWSPSMERITGVPAAEARGKSVAYLLRGRGQFGEQVTLSVSESPEPVELEIVATNGSVRWLRAQHGPGFDPDGALLFDVIVVTDVTRQREVDRLKDDFVSTVSHELRTPLTPIKGYAALLLRRGDDVPADRKTEALQSILERADHMGRLVEDLLLASRIGSGDRRMPEVALRPVDIGKSVDKIVRNFRTGHPHREFRVRENGGEIVATGDPIRVEQIVANLVSNAVKFSDEGTLVDIEIAQADGFASISVRDEGRGIPAEKIPEIFEKFKRLEDPLRMETGGAGLGLFIVSELSRAMGGSVSVDSDVGLGSTFTVLLPVEAAARPPFPGRRRSDGITPEAIAAPERDTESAPPAEPE